MAEPNTTAGTALMVAALGPLAGEYSVIVFAALAGALWPLSAAATATRREGALLLLRLVLTASVMTGAIAWLIQKYIGMPTSVALAPVSFLVAAIGDKWRDVLQWVLERVRAFLAGGAK